MIRAIAILTVTALGFSMSGAPALSADLLLGADQRIDGVAANDFAATSSASAGDFNGDGTDDMVIGASAFDYLGRADSGAAFVVFGSSSPTPTIDLNALGSRGIRIGGSAAGDGAGYSVAGGEDFNADGYDDVVIGAPEADFNLRDKSGSVYVVFGGPSPVELDLATLLTRGARIDGAVANSLFGRSVASPGDVNGDGRPDVLGGAPETGVAQGAAFVALAPFSGTLDLLAPGSSGYAINGAAGGGRAGTAVAGAGDLNRDGRADVLVGAPQVGNNGRPFSGSTYVVYGLPSPASISLASLGGAGFRIDGAVAAQQSGRSVGSGDVNGDGSTDILIGAPFSSFNGRINSGSVHVVLGGADLGPTDLASLGSTGIRLDGAAASLFFGSVLTAVDLSGDRIDDVVAASVRASGNGRVDSGSIYIVNGGPAVASRDLGVTAPDRQFDGAAAYDLAGASLASVGDVDKDGSQDLMIGAPWADNNARTNSGSAYIVFGDPIRTGPGATPDPTATMPTPATLTVVARKAGKGLPRRGKVRLVRKIAVGQGQSAVVDVSVKPRKTRQKVKVTKRANSVTVRTKGAPKGKVTVRITSEGAGFTPTKWQRSWRVR